MLRAPKSLTSALSSSRFLGLVAICLSFVLASFAAVAQPFPATLNATMIGSNATLRALVNANGLSTAAWFEWGPGPGYGNSTGPTNIGAGVIPAALEMPLAGLNSGVVYHFRMVATNAMGRSSSSDGAFEAPRLALNGPPIITNECHTPFSDPGISNRFAVPLALAIGYQHSLALKGDGTVSGWGDDAYGEISGAAGLSNVVAIAAGSGQGDYSLALLADGTVVGWGYNGFGEVTIPPGLTNVAGIDASSQGEFSLARTLDGYVIAWGAGQINNPSDGINFGQAIVPPGLSNVVAISAGGFFGLALRNEGAIIGWGADDSGQTDIPAAATNVVAISAGSFSGLALRRDGSVVAWGDDTFGQTEVPAGLNNIVAIAAGGFHNLALRRDGRVFAWGDDTFGEIDIPFGVNNVVAIAAGVGTSLALKADGTVIGWGDNSSGETTIPPGLAALSGAITTVTALDANTPGLYGITYSLPTGRGDIGLSTRIVNVMDTIPPALSLAGQNPQPVLINTPFNDPGASATDSCAGDLTSAIIITGAVNTNVAGVYTVNYRVSDPGGNSVSSNRTVVVLSGLVTTQPATEITDSSATLRALAFPDNLETQVYFEWGLDSNYGNLTTTNILATGSSVVPVSAGISGLVPGNTYHFRAVGTNQLGVSFGDDQSFYVPIRVSLQMLRSGQFVLEFRSATNAGYNVLTTQDITVPLTNWTVLGQPTALTNNLFQFIDTNAPSSPRFYFITVP